MPIRHRPRSSRMRASAWPERSCCRCTWPRTMRCRCWISWCGCACSRSSGLEDSAHAFAIGLHRLALRAYARAESCRQPDDLPARTLSQGEALRRLVAIGGRDDAGRIEQREMAYPRGAGQAYEFRHAGTQFDPAGHDVASARVAADVGDLAAGAAGHGEEVVNQSQYVAHGELSWAAPRHMLRNSSMKGWLTSKVSG